MKASDILQLNDRKTTTVFVDDWDMTVHIRELGLDEGIKLFSMAQNLGDNPTLTGVDIAQVIAWGVIDPETGERMFSDDQVPELATKSQRPLMQLYAAISELSGDDAEKN